MAFQNIFPVPIYTTILDNKIVEYMKNLIIPRLSNLEQVPSQKTDFFKSKIISPEELSPFFSSIKSSIKDYSIKSNLFLPSNLNYWVQDYSQNESHSSHTHGEATISGVYYVRANQYAGSLKFTNPNPLFNVTNFNDGAKNEINFEVTPQKGLLVLFPGWLLHEAMASPNKDCIRTCLAFNLIK